MCRFSGSFNLQRGMSCAPTPRAARRARQGSQRLSFLRYRCLSHRHRLSTEQSLAEEPACSRRPWPHPFIAHLLSSANIMGSFLRSAGSLHVACDTTANSYSQGVGTLRPWTACACDKGNPTCASSSGGCVVSTYGATRGIHFWNSDVCPDCYCTGGGDDPITGGKQGLAVVSVYDGNGTGITQIAAQPATFSAADTARVASLVLASPDSSGCGLGGYDMGTSLLGAPGFVADDGWSLLSFRDPEQPCSELEVAKRAGPLA